MIIWVEDKKTKDCWKLDHDISKPIYIQEDGSTHIDLSQVGRYQFYPVCPREAPMFDVPEHGEQMDIFEFLEAYDGVD